MMMLSQAILHLTALTVLLCSVSATDQEGLCPQTCICRTSGTLDEVTCHDLNLTSVPRDLPSSIVRLDLANNTLTELDVSQLAFLRRPAEVVLSGNRIQSIVDSRRPEAATPVQIQILWLNHNRLSSVAATAMHALSETLVQLDLADNRLSSVEDVFAGCRLLSRLDLRQNLLTQISSNTFRDLVSLRYLRLEDNLISSVSVDAFIRLEHLSYLVLKGNPIAATPSSDDGPMEFRFATDFLSYVDLSETGLQRIPLGLPPSVRYLQLRKNRLKVLSRKDFAGLRQLGILILDDNEIEDIEDGSFENLVHLSQLWMNGNRLTVVPLRLPSNVQRLLLDSNRIQTVTDQSFVGLSQVRTLSLMGNAIAGIKVGTFDVFEQLTSLDLSGNRISRIHPGTFRRNVHIQVLHLSKNPLHALDQGAFEGLTRLDQLSASYIPPSSSHFVLDALTDLQRLTRLDLDGSTDVIRALVTSGGSRLRPLFLGLRDLSLMKSDLIALPRDFISSLPQLASLRISSDRWHCDRSLLWLRDWLANSSSSVATGDNRCLSPRHVTGRLLSSLADDEFAASEGRRHLASDFEGTLSVSQTTRFPPSTLTTTTTTLMSKDSVLFGDVAAADLRTRRPKTKTKDLIPSSTRANTDWLTNGPVQGISFNGETNHDSSIPATQEVRETSNTDTATPWALETAVTTPVSSAIVRRNFSVLSSYSGESPSSGSVKLFHHLNRTGHARNPTGSDASSPEQTNVTTSANSGDDYVIEPAQNNALSFDAIVAMGTVAGTMVTAVVMVAVIVHLCRKEKSGVETSRRPNSLKQTTEGLEQREEREVVYCTPDLYADVERDRRTSVGSRDRTASGAASTRHSSTTREADRPSKAGHGTRMSTSSSSSKACWESGAASEATGLMGRMGDACGRMPDTQMRVYKWEEL